MPDNTNTTISVTAATDNGPPKNTSSTELWAALTALPTPHEIVDFPINEPVFGKSVGQVAIVPLAPEDLMVSQKVADAWARDLLCDGVKTPENKAKVNDQTDAYRKVFNDEAAVQVLWRSLKDPNDKTFEKPAFAAAGLLRRKPFTPDIIAVLMNMYLRVCVKCGPIVALMDKAEMDAWLDALEEGGSATPLGSCSSGMLIDLVMRSAERSKALRTANGSPGQPQGGSSSGQGTPTVPQNEPTPPEPQQDSAPSASADVVVIPDADKPKAIL